MINKVIIIIVFSLFIKIDLYSCKCDFKSYDSIQSRSFKSADIVFYGKLIHYDSISFIYSFKIFEIFKGSFSNDTIFGKSNSSCSLYNLDKGLWIVYANFDKDSIIDISQCGASRSIVNPRIMLYSPPALLPLGFHQSEMDKLKDKMSILELKQRATVDWFMELESLRKLKTSEIAVKESSAVKCIYFLIFINIIMIVFIVSRKKRL